MTLTLVREHCWPDRVEGRLSIDGIFACWTLEPARRAENPTLDHPAIPAGTYPIVIAYSPRFQANVPHVQNVPGRQNIEIHAGNAVVDTHGCILVGEQRFGSGVIHSRDALDALMVTLAQALSKHQAVTLTVEDPMKGVVAA